MKNLYIGLVTLLAYSFIKHRPIGWVFYGRLFLISLAIYFFAIYR
jgi:hypothetical protein